MDSFVIDRKLRSNDLRLNPTARANAAVVGGDASRSMILSFVNSIALCRAVNSRSKTDRHPRTMSATGIAGGHVGNISGAPMHSERIRM
jgi:hypothetical protein